MNATNWPELAQMLSGELRNLRGGAPQVMKGFSAIAQAALTPGVLDVKTKELIALAISVAVRCDDCVAFHAKAAVEQGASREEMLERMARYAQKDLANGGRLAAITRHMLGLYGGQPGAKEYRRYLSEGSRAAGAGPDLLRNAGKLIANQAAVQHLSV